ncbi:MAG: hypothetical protein QOJ94_1360 [Sphingomonadales bacterium]|jgi:hypothetical protein|nr:hypothetical protein [Sphingomonadales bacterium]
MKRLIGKGVTRLFASLFIWLVFMVFLTTAVTQQSVSARVEKTALDLGYSGTLALVKDFNQRQQELPDLRRAQTELLKELNREQEADHDAQGKYRDSWEAALPIIKLLSKVPECEIPLDPKKPVAERDRVTLWQQAKVCVSQHAIKLSKKTVESVDASAFIDLHRKAVTTSDAVRKTQKQVDDGAAAIAKAANPSADEAKAIASFRDADVLRGFSLTRWLVDFPPPVLQLLLSASAGAFGALLITLILLVYPKTDLKFSSSGGFWERIMLGGFIAVCVYIVLLGGTAVLGTASFDQAGANYMTFCAISVLAGMFSDRVAHWLSNRADLFFKEKGAGEAPDGPQP